MTNLAIKETLQVAGIMVPNINGGFGEGKKSMLAKHIAEIHGKKLFKVNEVIENNRDRFNDNVDIIDIKLIRQTDTFLEAGILTKAQIGNASNIYLLSERGYAKLIKLFNDDKSWELYDNLLDEYFDLRDANVVQMNNQPTSQLQVLQLAINQMVQQEQELLEIKQKQLEQENKVIQLETEFNKETVTEGFKSNDNLARHFKLYSMSDKPHFGFIDAIAKHIRIYNNTIGYKDEYVNAKRENLYGGTVGVSVYYSDKSFGLIHDFLLSEFNLKLSQYKRGENKGKFKESTFTLDNKTFKFNEKTYNYYK